MTVAKVTHYIIFVSLQNFQNMSLQMHGRTSLVIVHRFCTRRILSNYMYAVTRFGSNFPTENCLILCQHLKHHSFFFLTASIRTCWNDECWWREIPENQEFVLSRLTERIKYHNKWLQQMTEKKLLVQKSMLETKTKCLRRQFQRKMLISERKHSGNWPTDCAVVGQR